MHTHTQPITQALQAVLARAEAAWAEGTRPEVVALDVEWRAGIYGARGCDGFGFGGFVCCWKACVDVCVCVWEGLFVEGCASD